MMIGPLNTQPCHVSHEPWGEQPRRTATTTHHSCRPALTAQTKAEQHGFVTQRPSLWYPLVMSK